MPAGEGGKTAYVKFKDAAGNWSIAHSDTTILDNTPPSGTVAINNGGETTDNWEVVLNLSINDSGSGMASPAQMQFSNDNTDWSVPEYYAATKSWSLSSGFGVKTVYAKFKDAAGNWSESISDTIEVLNVPKERIYIYLNGQRVAMEENGKKYFFHNDHLGGTNIVTDEAGQQVKYMDYQPYGETKTEEGSLAVKKKFTGKELDDSTGLYDYAARQYDPKIGRFITADPIDFSDAGVKLAGGKDLPTFLANPQNLNRYSYCLNNPIKFTDPDGLLTELVPGIKIPWNRKGGWSQKSLISKNLIAKGETVREFSWPGFLFSKNLYKSLANELIEAKRLADIKKEKFNIVAQSWGGPATVEVLSALKLEVDNLITLSSPVTSLINKPQGVKKWTNFFSPIDPFSWPSFGTNADQNFILGIHFFDFENPFVVKGIQRIIIKDNNNAKKKAKDEN
ncbi:MAG: hypothetical protein FJZ07_02755 [Candidatus Nealsonbacteria bacterium]|nr:hypothetical protein [Candidatus Nealsonbacteria bacterium]